MPTSAFLSRSFLSGIAIFGCAMFAASFLLGCCMGGEDRMVIYVSAAPDPQSAACNSLPIVWNGESHFSTADQITVLGHDAGEGPPADYVQVFQADGTRVPVVHERVEDHTCQGGCPVTRDFYAMPPPGEYDLVHFASAGDTPDFSQLVSYEHGGVALVTHLTVE